MPETVSLTLELPKEFVARVKALKPSWLIELTDEEYLGHVIAKGNFDDYLQQLENANVAVKKLAADLHLSKKTGGTQSKNNKGGQRPGNKTGQAQAGEKPTATPLT